MHYQNSTTEMLKELKEATGIFSSAEKNTVAKSAPRVRQQVVLELSMRLQMSLELEWVVAQFMEQIHPHLLFDGYIYQQGELKLEFGTGRHRGHHCSYNLSIDDSQLGKLMLYRGRKYTESELELLESLLCSLLYPLRNAIQYRKATLSAHCDPLTGVNNRTTFDAALIREMSLAQRSDSSFAMLIIDIDHFKKVNDSFGHSAGDEVLKNVATQIKKSIRSTDQLFRFGGEEFVVLLNNSDCEIADFIAERILENVRGSRVQYQNHALAVSVSIGLACLRKNDTVEGIFNRADQALYSAKNDGRNRVRVA